MTILIVLGSVMLIVVIFGDYGTCNEKRCALQVVRDGFIRFVMLGNGLTVFFISCRFITKTRQSQGAHRY